MYVSFAAGPYHQASRGGCNCSPESALSSTMQHTPFTQPYPVRNGESIGFIKDFICFHRFCTSAAVGFEPFRVSWNANFAYAFSGDGSQICWYACGIRNPLQVTQAGIVDFQMIFQCFRITVIFLLFPSTPLRPLRGSIHGRRWNSKDFQRFPRGGCRDSEAPG